MFHNHARARDAFIGRHGDPAIWAAPGFWLLPDGATIGHDGMSTTLNEPPADVHARWLARRRYLLTRLRWFEIAISHLTGALAGSTAPFRWSPDRLGAAPPTGMDGRAALRVLYTRAQRCRDALSAMCIEVGAPPHHRVERLPA